MSSPGRGQNPAKNVSLEPPALDFGTVLIREEETREIVLLNSHPCKVRFALGWVNDGPGDPPPDLISFSVKEGEVPARTHLTVRVYFRPRKREDIACRVYCRALSASQSSPKAAPSASELAALPSCSISGSGGQPQVEVGDVRCVTVSKAHLWSQFTVDALNEALRGPTDQFDEDRKEFEFKNFCARHAHFPFDFGSAVQSTPPTTIFLSLKNIGSLTADFQFHLPSDSAVPTERWFHEVMPTAEDFHRERILDNSLFVVEPKRGRIQPGQSFTVTLTYTHKYAEAHRLPVLFSVANGRSVVLDFAGRTLHQDERHLDLLTTQHSFAPVAIGDLDAPAQFFELRNASHVSVSYELSAEPFREICNESFDFPVFQCLNSYGEIPPLSSVSLRWCFRPLEVKEYRMVVPIMIKDGGPTYEVEFRGRGYHPKQTSDEELADIAAREFIPIAPFPAPIPDPRTLPMVLSTDILRFGRIPVHSLHRRLIILRNRHPSDAFIFEWKPELQHGDQIIEVQPASGRIACGDHVVCKLSMYAGSLCQLVEHSIQCHVLNDDLRLRRQAAREVQEEEARMDLDAADEEIQSTPSPEHPTTSSSPLIGPRKSRKKPTRVPVTQPPPKYQTTAQLRNTMQKLIDSANPDNLEENDEDLVWVDVQATALDLRIQMRVMSSDAFRSAEPHLWNRQFMPTLAIYQEHIDPSYPPPLPPEQKCLALLPPERPSSASVIAKGSIDPPPTEEEADFVEAILGSLLQETVRSPAILQAFTEIDELFPTLYSHVTGVGPRSPRAPSISLTDSPAATPREVPEEEDPPGCNVEAIEVWPVGTTAVVPDRGVGKVVSHARGRVAVEFKNKTVVGAPAGMLRTPEQAEEEARTLARRKRREELRGQLEQTLELRERERKAAQERSLLQNGQFQCMVEEIFEGIAFDIIKDAALDPGTPSRSLVPPKKPRLRVANVTSAARSEADYTSSVHPSSLHPSPSRG